MQQDAILKELQTARGTAQSTGSAMNSSTDPPDTFGTSVLDFVTSKLNRRDQSQERLLLRRGIIDAIHKAPANHPQTGSSPVNIYVSDEARMWFVNLLVKSLRYSGMKDREERIAEAHKSTFRWLLKNDDDDNNNKWASFKDWLESDEKLYWITGKAGSGKSTLMKYVCHPVESTEGRNPEPRCREFLTTWSRANQLIIASFYFWNSGIQTQMTQKGLLVSLLHNILKECPDLAPLACPNRWESLCLVGDDLPEWTDRELRDTLRLAVKNISNLQATIALFVDGLDEFAGKPEELISLFQDIITFQGVKLCVASRPWVEFEDAFERKPSLMLERLNYNDIKSFVTSRFHNEPVFDQLRRREEEFADQLIEDIVSKAAGVFLWVALVVSSLIAGMSFGDRVSDLKRRLNLLPPDLSKLYEKMISSLDPFYLEHAAQLFSLVEVSYSPMDLVLASFADEEDPDFALHREVRPLSRDEIVLRMDTMRRRINSRSKGLLEVKGLESSATEGVIYDPNFYERCTVQYLHRTVKDYIQRDDVQKTLQDAMKSTFDPHLRLLAAHIANIKGLDITKFTTDIFDLWFPRFESPLMMASDVLLSGIPKMILLLENLYEAGSAIIRAFATSERHRGVGVYPGPWDYFRSFSDSPTANTLISPESAVLGLAVEWGVIEYVRAKARSPCLIQWPDFDFRVYDKPRYVEWPLLMNCIRSGISVSSRVGDVNLKMIQCLLDKGADPNYIVDIFRDLDRTSPLIMSITEVLALANRVPLPKELNNRIEVTRLLAKARRIDSETVDRAMEIFLDESFVAHELGPRPKKSPFVAPRFSPRRRIQWHGVKKSLLKALQQLARGENPDFVLLVVKIRSLALRN